MKNKTNMRAICLCGGAGTRLYPITKGISKQLIPVYDKPMIYYPISALMLAGIRDILIITTLEDSSSFKRLLGDGSNYGVRFSYAVQPNPEGLAQAFIIANDCGWLGNDEPCALVLGDNIFYGAGFTGLLNEAINNSKQCMVSDESTVSVVPGMATVFGYWVPDPERYGVAEMSNSGTCLSIEEKPTEPKSNYAVVGLYFYPNDVVEKARKVTPSERGELEITTLNQMYLQEKRLKVNKFPRGFAWLDTGTFDSLSEASDFVKTIERRQGMQIACLEEIAYKNGWITKKELNERGHSMDKNAYGKYLLTIGK